MAVVTNINLSGQRLREQFPNVFLEEVNQTTPVVVSLLEKGDIPVIGELNGERKVIAHMSSSAYNIDKLMRTHSSVRYSKSETERFSLTSIADYLEVVAWT